MPLILQSVEMNPGFAHGMRGTLSADYRMVRVCELGGLVESPVPSLRDIKKSYAIWWVLYNVYSNKLNLVGRMDRHLCMDWCYTVSLSFVCWPLWRCFPPKRYWILHYNRQNATKFEKLQYYSNLLYQPTCFLATYSECWLSYSMSSTAVPASKTLTILMTTSLKPSSSPTSPCHQERWSLKECWVLISLR